METRGNDPRRQRLQGATGTMPVVPIAGKVANLSRLVLKDAVVKRPDPLQSRSACTFPGCPVVLRPDAESRTRFSPVLETGCPAVGSSD